MRLRIAAAVSLALAAASLSASAPLASAGEHGLRAGPKRFDVVLGLSHHQRAMNRFARRVSAPASSRYGHYLDPQAVGRRVGARPRVVRSVRGFLRRRGVASEVDVTRTLVEALVPTRKARRLFGRPSSHSTGVVPRALRGRVRQVLIARAEADQFL